MCWTGAVRATCWILINNSRGKWFPNTMIYSFVHKPFVYFHFRYRSYFRLFSFNGFMGLLWKRPCVFPENRNVRSFHGWIFNRMFSHLSHFRNQSVGWLRDDTIGMGDAVARAVKSKNDKKISIRYPHQLYLWSRR